MSLPCVPSSSKAAVQASANAFIKAWEQKNDASGNVEACRIVNRSGFIITGSESPQSSGMACHSLPYSIVRFKINGELRYALRVTAQDQDWLETHAGSYGCVELVQLLDKRDGQYTISNQFKCLKFIEHKKHIRNPVGHSEALREFERLNTSGLQADDCFEIPVAHGGNRSVIVMDFIDGVRPVDAVKRIVATSTSSYHQYTRFKKIAYSALASLKALHAKNLVHLDINTRNCLYNKVQNKLRFVDFGGSIDLSGGILKAEADHVTFSTDCGPLYQLSLLDYKLVARGEDAIKDGYLRHCDLESFGRMMFFLAEKLTDGLHKRYFQMLLLQHFILTDRPSIEKFEQGLDKLDHYAKTFERVFISNCRIPCVDGASDEIYLLDSIRLKTLSSYNHYFNKYFTSSPQINRLYQKMTFEPAVAAWCKGEYNPVTGCKKYTAQQKAELDTAVAQLDQHMKDTIAKMAIGMLENYSNLWLNFFCFHWFRSSANIALVKAFLATGNGKDIQLEQVVAVIDEWMTPTNSDAKPPVYSITQSGSLWRRCNYIKHVSGVCPLAAAA